MTPMEQLEAISTLMEPWTNPLNEPSQIDWEVGGGVDGRGAIEVVVWMGGERLRWWCGWEGSG